MKSLTQSVAMLNSITKVPSADTTNTTLLTNFWQDSVRTVLSIRSGKWWFLQTLKTIQTDTTLAGAYPIPAGCRSIMDLYVTVGNVIYVPRPVHSPEAWNIVLASRLGSSDVPLFYYVQGNKILIQPIPSSNTGVITVRARKNIPDFTVADLTTSTVTTATTGSTSVVLNAGALVSMAGKYIRITNTSAANTGDGQWYEIASAVVATQTLTLVAPYEGTSIVAGTAACTIAQMSPIPEAYDMAPIYRAVALFFQLNDPLHPAVAQAWWKLYDGGQEAGLVALPGGIIGQMMENAGESIEGAYVAPMSSGNLNPYNPPYWHPFQDASGF